MADDHVDRPEVYARQCVQPTGTNRPRAWIDNDVRARYGVLEGVERRRRRSPLTTGFGGHGGGVTPVPIPNTEVKPASADGTWGETPWESRSPPDFSHDEGPREGAFVVVRGRAARAVGVPGSSPSALRPARPIGAAPAARAARRRASRQRRRVRGRAPTGRGRRRSAGRRAEGRPTRPPAPDDAARRRTRRGASVRPSSGGHAQPPPVRRRRRHEAQAGRATRRTEGRAGTRRERATDGGSTGAPPGEAGREAEAAATAPARRRAGAAGRARRPPTPRRPERSRRRAREARAEPAAGRGRPTAFERERFARRPPRSCGPLADARRPAPPSVRELHGLTLYRLGRGGTADPGARGLPHADRLDRAAPGAGRLLPGPRAATARSSELWDELREASPSAELVAEGRIVVAGALADRGDRGRGHPPARAGPATVRSGRRTTTCGCATPWPTSTSGPATCPGPGTCSAGSSPPTPTSPTPPTAARPGADRRPGTARWHTRRSSQLSHALASPRRLPPRAARPTSPSQCRVTQTRRSRHERRRRCGARCPAPPEPRTLPVGRPGRRLRGHRRARPGRGRVGARGLARSAAGAAADLDAGRRGGRRRPGPPPLLPGRRAPPRAAPRWWPTAVGPGPPGQAGRPAGRRTRRGRSAPRRCRRPSARAGGRAGVARGPIGREALGTGRHRSAPAHAGDEGAITMDIQACSATRPRPC